MKNLIYTAVILLMVNTSCAVFKPDGLYLDTRSYSELLLKKDGTFYYSFDRGMCIVETAGKWVDEKDKIRFQSDDSCSLYRYDEAFDSSVDGLKINYFKPNDSYPYNYHIPVILAKDGKDTIVDSKYGENYFSSEFLDFDTIFFKSRYSDLLYTRLNKQSNVININTEPPSYFVHYWRNITMKKIFPMRLEWVDIRKDDKYREFERIRFVFKKKFREPRTRFVKKHYE